MARNQLANYNPGERVIIENYEYYFTNLDELDFEPREIARKALSHFRQCQSANLPITSSGLAIVLGLTRDELLEKSKDQTPQGQIIRRCLSICEKYAEAKLLASNQPSGAIFVLKNLNPSWKDRNETELKGNFNLTFLLKSLKEKNNED